MPPAIPFADYVWRRVDKDAGGDCWLWTGGTFASGEPYASHREATSRSARRAVWQLVLGSEPEWVNVTASCGVALCVNPDHTVPMNRTHCQAGHLYSDDSRIDKHGYPRCRQCKRVKDAERRERKRQLRALAGER